MLSPPPELRFTECFNFVSLLEQFCDMFRVDGLLPEGSELWVHGAPTIGLATIRGAASQNS
jgi:hypothetical protein